jgi:PBP1b-binding outer membrane lipoprotein LpoB
MKKTIAVVAVCLLLAGCQNAGNRSKATASESANLQAKAEPNSLGSSNDAIMYSCMKELNALQQLNPALYQTKGVELNRIVTQAKLYMKVRESVSSNTTLIMDSAYQFRIAKACNDIRTDLTNALVDRVETN